MRVVSLASGSSGNALLVEAGPKGRTKLLVDVGIGPRLLSERLLTVGVHLSQIRIVLVTHEHRDHVQALPVLMKRYGIPVMTDPRTYQAIEASIAAGMWLTDSGTAVPMQNLQPAEGLYCAEELIEGVVPGAGRVERFSPLPIGSSALVGDIEITSFPTSHDAVAPCGYLLRAGGCRVCIVTDTGEVTTTMLDHMQHADLLIIEANHDRARLLRGPYPYRLKQRILSASGHLSNDQTAEAILRTWRPDGVRWLWLSHLSQTNNLPSLALKSIRARLQEAHADLSLVHFSISPPGLGPLWDSTQLWHAHALWEMSS